MENFEETYVPTFDDTPRCIACGVITRKGHRCKVWHKIARRRKTCPSRNFELCSPDDKITINRRSVMCQTNCPSSRSSVETQTEWPVNERKSVATQTDRTVCIPTATGNIKDSLENVLQNMDTSKILLLQLNNLCIDFMSKSLK